MLRQDHRREHAIVSDRELGIAAMLLLIAVVLTVAFAPSII